jgi:hypothetical protein
LHYQRNPTYYNMSQTFSNILSSRFYTDNSMRMLIYNGDLDTVCHFVGDQWLIEDVARRQNLSV